MTDQEARDRADFERGDTRAARSEERYACQQKGCGKDDLDEGEIWSCTDCGEDFCEQHTTQIDVTDAGRYSEFLCRRCEIKRYGSFRCIRRIRRESEEVA